jgi:hypothetical protein
MALAWSFVLASGEEAFITYVLSETEPSGFYLSQTDPDSDATVYFTSSLTIREAQELPEPAAILLLGAGLVALGFARRQRAA